MKLLVAFLIVCASFQSAVLFSQDKLIEQATIRAPSTMRIRKVQEVMAKLQSFGIDAFKLKADDSASELTVVLHTDVDPERMDVLVLIQNLEGCRNQKR